ncbi:MAG TPA: hypothetical protein VK324_03910, partial [Tepidisphaeraceae bacterium]|nr:hypothetical protein [Tepidisphaeraceae bacterium]
MLESRLLLHAGGLEFLPVPAHLQSGDVGGGTPGAPVGPLHPLSALPVLQSNPTASAKLVLDFDGDDASLWDYGGGSYAVPATPAYTRDADPATFSNADLAAIRHIWQTVAEKYGPFNLDVTTVDPGALEDGGAQKVVIGGDGTWFAPHAGGVGTYGGFAGAADNRVYVFSAVSAGHPDVVAEAAAHEAGHGFGLNHQVASDAGGGPGDDYNAGTDAVSPVMGFNPSSARKTWWHGHDALGAWQDDADLLAGTANGFGYRADDHGDHDPLTVDGGAVSASGLIGPHGDADGFLLSLAARTRGSFRVTVPAVGATLDARLEVRTDAGAGGYRVVATADTGSLGEQLLDVDLPAGDYSVVVTGTPAVDGAADAMGSYALSGLLAPAEQPALTVDEGRTAAFTAAGPTSGVTYAWDLDGDGTFGETGAAAARGGETGRAVTFSAAGLDGPTTMTVGLELRGPNGMTSRTTATVAVHNVAPTLAATGAPTATLNAD